MAITYTRDGLKSVIADDLARADLTNQIEDAIETAITNLKETRFWFTESRTTTFSTVATQSAYATADDADIPLFRELDAVYLTDSDGSVFPLSMGDIIDMQWLLGNGAASGRPYEYAYFGGGFVFYPIPDAVYTITPMGHIEVAAPANDTDAGNPWMVNAFELIRSMAKAYLYTHIIKDQTEAGVYVDAAQGAKRILTSSTNRRIATGNISRTSF